MGCKLSPVFLVFLIVSLVIPLYQIPKVKAREEAKTGSFGNSDLPDWLNVTVSDYSANIIVDNGDGFVWEFSKDKDKFNQIYENDVLIVKDEQWLLIGEDLKEDSHPAGKLEWEQPEPYHVIVTDYYQDSKKNNNFTVIYDFYGGFHPKITFNASIGTAQNYTIDWRCWLYKDNALVEPEKHRVKFWNEKETGVVFNYEDVYINFGSITEVDVAGWFKGKRFDLKFNVRFLNETFTLDPTFGNTEIESGVFIWQSYDFALKAQAPEDGTINSIWIYIEGEASGAYVCVAVYENEVASPDHPDARLYKSADIEDTNTTWHWYEFTGVDLEITEDLYYWLAFNVNGSMDARYGIDDGISVYWNAESHPGLDNPFGNHIDATYSFSIYAEYTPSGQDLAFNLFENFNVWASTTKAIETSNTFYQNFNVWDSLSFNKEVGIPPLFESFNVYSSIAFNKEVGFKLYEPFNLYEYLVTSKEQSFTFFQPFNIWSSLSHSVETAYQDLHFTLFEPFNLWEYLEPNKEQAFTFYEAINLWSSIIMTPEGVALDLYFTFFEGFNPWASMGTVIAEELTLEDVYGLAALGFIMAIVAICLAVAFKKK